MKIVSYVKTLLKKNHKFVSGDSVEWLGTKYGGFFVDTSLLTRSSTLLSFGVGEDISFDLQVSERNIREIFLFDPTPRSIAFVNRMDLPSNFHFYSVGVSDKDEDASFFLPKNDRNVSGSLLVHRNLDANKEIKVSLKKLSTIKQELRIDQIDILKIDIEGSEYKVLKNIMEDKIFPTQLCVEFHNEFFKNGKELFEDIGACLKGNGYEIKAVSETGKEYLFVNISRRNQQNTISSI